MSIPEVESRNRLLAFLKKYFALKGSSGGAGAPTDAQYVTLATDGDLSAERVLTQGTGLTVTDGGAGSTVTVKLADTSVTPGSYTRTDLTVDAQGRVTAASNGSAGGDVNVSGTPSNNQVPTWTDSTTIKGEGNLTFDGTTLAVTGAVTAGSLTVTTIDASGLASLDGGIDVNGNMTVSTAGAITGGTSYSGSTTIQGASLSVDGAVTAGSLNLGGAAVTATATEINYLDNASLTAADLTKLAAVYATAAQLNYNYNVTAGTAKAAKSVVLDASKNVTGINDLTCSTLTTTGQPMVYAFRNSTQDLNPDASFNTVIFNDDSTTNDTAFNVGTDYNTTNGVFTAPTDGKYLISAEVMLTNTNTTDGNIMLKCITTNSAADLINQYAGRVNPDTFATEPDYVQIPGTWLASMDSGDTAYVQVRNTAADTNSKIYGASTSTYTRIQIMKVA